MLKLVTVEELSRELAISEGSIYNMVHKQQIPFIKIGKRVRFDLEEIDKWLNKNSVNPPIVGPTIS